jgi:elongation of very long chain fatty acids protein 6
MQTHNFVPIVACFLYAALVVLGRRVFRSLDRCHWRLTLASWNVALSLFSTMGMLRTAPQLLHNLTHMSLHDNLCVDPRATYGSGSTGLWVQLFIISKFPYVQCFFVCVHECYCIKIRRRLTRSSSTNISNYSELLDTFFIVIHKKPLIFLHWYHHITVLLYCWHSYVTVSPPGIFFVAMNYSVHAIMYFYYFLMAMHIKPKWLNPVVITMAQISQMVVGVAVTLAALYYKMTSSSCAVLTKENNAAALIMYGSYLCLFLQFFVARYLRAPKNRGGGDRVSVKKEV